MKTNKKLYSAALVSVALILFLVLTLSTVSALSVTTTNLGIPQGYLMSYVSDINDKGQIVGYSESLSVPNHAFLWENGVMTDLGTLPGGSYSRAYSINDNGQIVGHSSNASGPTHAFLWENGVMTDLGTFSGGSSSQAWGINDNGQIVGYSGTSSGSNHAVLWENGVMTDLGTLPGGSVSYANGINNKGQIVGISSMETGESHAFLWENGVTTDLGTLPEDFYSIACGINDNGQIVGFSQNYLSGSKHAFLWENGVMTDLGTLPGDPISYANDINNKGQIVGYSGMGTMFGSAGYGLLWENGVMTDLEPLPGDLYSDCTGINNNGQIIGYSQNSSNDLHAVLWTLLKTPIIIWSNPADIIAGTELSSIQLNAVAKDPDSGDPIKGIFTYNPAAGTVLGAGMGQTLHVDFVPIDTANYTNASKDVTINVLSIPAPTINSIVVPLDPVPVGTSVTTSANITYQGDFSTLTAEWNWGDGSTSPSPASSNFAASHVYNSAGLYTITFTLKDKNGGIYTQTSPNCVVVYDPQGGFVTGGGWINSPAGAYVPDNTLAGKATFGFVSKYEKGVTVPTGKTEFQFKVANLNFHSVNYDWLVVTGSQAKYKGTGTINGEGNYGFMLSVVDGAIKGDNIDKFRIKIWDKESGNTIYDNEIGAGEDAETSTAISGGSIIIHKEK